MPDVGFAGQQDAHCANRGQPAATAGSGRTDWTPRSTAGSWHGLTLFLLLVVFALSLPAHSWGQATTDDPNLGEAAPLPGAVAEKKAAGTRVEDTKPAEAAAADPIAPDAGAGENPVANGNPETRIAEPEPVAAATSEPSATPAAPDKSYLIPTDPIQLFLAGGFLMWPILLASIISLWFVLERMVVLRRPRVIPRAFVDRFIQHLEQGKLNAETALRLCEENHSPIADVFAHGIRKWGKTSVEVEQAIIDGGERQVAQLRTHLRIINGVATVAPLLGLLGTVVGMIMSFNELAQGGDADRAERLAGGIGVALITTAAGLFVAIPSLILYMFLAGKVDGLVMEMDHLAQKVVNLISSEALASRPRTGVAKSLNPPPAGNPSGTKTKAVGT